VMRQSAKEALFIQNLADEFGVRTHEIASKAYESAAQRAAAPAQQTPRIAA
jgi:hypothetical protein